MLSLMAELKRHKESLLNLTANISSFTHHGDTLPSICGVKTGAGKHLISARVSQI